MQDSQPEGRETGPVHRLTPLYVPSGRTSTAPGPRLHLPLRGLVVMVVDDSRFACDAMRLMLHRLGARMRRAGTLAAARAHLARQRFDAAIVDLGLPDGPGEALVAELATAGGAGGPRVIVASGDPGGRAVARAAGAQGFLEKPVLRIADLAAAILDHLPADGRPRDAAALPAGGVRPDPLALRDDLAAAAGLLSAGPDAGTLRYLSGFVAGIARQAGDADLADLARSAVGGGLLPQLGAVIADRMTRSRHAAGPV